MASKTGKWSPPDQGWLTESWGLDAPLPESAGGKEVPSNGKSDEEVARFTVDERLSEVERLVLYLNGGQIIQQRQAIRVLPSVIKGRGRPAWDSIAPALKSALNKLDGAAQIDAADAFTRIAKERLMTPMDCQACLLPLVSRNINKEKSEEEVEAWLQVLFTLVPILDKQVVKSEVLPLALSKAVMEESVLSRCICARVLGSIAKVASKDDVEKGFFKQALVLCQDVDFHVRIAMCDQLPFLGRAVGPETVARQVTDEILELLKDEDVRVRVSGLHTLVALWDLLPTEVRRQRVMPVVRGHMQPFGINVEMQRCVASIFGQLLGLVKPESAPEDAPLFNGCFRHMAAQNDVELRKACASQLPIVARQGFGSYQGHFHDLATHLLSDTNEGVRMAIAEQFHELVKAAGKDAGTLLVRPLTRLLRDESRKVRATVLQELGVTLRTISSASASSASTPLPDSITSDLCHALVELEAAADSSKTWRLQNSLALTFPSFHLFFSPEQIYAHFVPIAFRMLGGSGGASPVMALRQAAAEGLSIFLRYGKKDRSRSELLLRLIRDFARGKSFNNRAAFIAVSHHILGSFSSRFVKDWFFDLCLELLYDPVPNVRLQATSLLPSLKQVIRLPEDVDLLERLNNAVSSVMTDDDRDVSASSRSVNEAFKRMPVRMGVGSQSVGGNASQGGNSSFEASDKKREEEEAQLSSFSSDEVKEIKNEIARVGGKKDSARGPASSQLTSVRGMRASANGETGSLASGSNRGISSKTPSSSILSNSASSSSSSRGVPASLGARGPASSSIVSSVALKSSSTASTASSSSRPTSLPQLPPIGKLGGGGSGPPPSPARSTTASTSTTGRATAPNLVKKSGGVK